MWVKTICKTFESDQVELTLNGEVVDPAKVATIAFPEGESPMNGLSESKMLLELPALWPATDVGNEFPNLLFDIDVTSSPDNVTFTGESRDTWYKVSASGHYQNDVLKLDLTYTPKMNWNAVTTPELTYELEFNKDAIDLSLATMSTMIEWNGEMVQREEFMRESLAMIFDDLIEKTGKDAVRFTFLKDGSMNVSFRNSQDGTFVPAPGHYAYRFDYANAGFFELGYDEALAFSKVFLPQSRMPNALFYRVVRDKAFIPVFFQEAGDYLFLALYYTYNVTNTLFLLEWKHNREYLSEIYKRTDLAAYLVGQGGIVYVRAKKVKE